MLDQLDNIAAAGVSSRVENPCADPLHTLWNDSSDGESGIFGLPFSVDEATAVIVPVPWDAACSQGTGSASAPDLILASSRYVELHDVVLGNIYERRIAMTPAHSELAPLAVEAQLLQSANPEPGALLDPVCWAAIIQSALAQ